MSNLKINYNECRRFIKNKLGINLYPYQEVMLKAFCEGLEVRTARGIGRTLVADAFGKYVASLVNYNNYDAEPDVVLPYTCALKDGVLNRGQIAFLKEECKEGKGEDWFKKEFMCQ